MNASRDGSYGQDLVLRLFLADLDDAEAPARQLERLLAEGWDRLPLPGSGRTLQRWQALAAVAAHDLSLAKLYEGHTDALAILSELQATGVAATEGALSPAGAAESALSDASRPQHPVWGVWAAEAPDCRVAIRAEPGAPSGTVRLHGRKAWCSGALSGTHGLLTAWWNDDRAAPQLVAVGLAQPGVRASDGGWQAVGMAGSASVQVAFDGALGHCVGEVGAYLSRPGFWQGGAGGAACWYGGAVGLAGALHRTLADSAPARRDRFQLAAAGRVDVTLRATAALLRETAIWIDSHPQEEARPAALRARLAAVACAESVLHEVGEALGAAPLCRNRRFALAAADLPVFIRQSHGQADFAGLGETVVEGLGLTHNDPAEGLPWAL
ncbi:MAG: acyl-CoA dehydrogenase [Polaromonas sp.]|nr:acyl-CoA dehydrogenase [Polaromonas sp.]